MIYTFTLRDDVYFHDGERVDAHDIVFSSLAQMTRALRLSWYKIFEAALGKDVDGPTYGNGSVTALDLDGDGFFETVQYHLKNKYAPFLPYIGGAPILPEHILGSLNHSKNRADWQVAPGPDWQTHWTNTGIDPEGRGPVGCGPFKWEKHPDWETKGTAKLVKFDHWHGNNITIGLPRGDVQELYVQVMPNKDAALHALWSTCEDQIHVVSPYFWLSSNYEDIRNNSLSSAILFPESGWQAMWFNLKHPLLTKNVRHALSHLIPRERIVLELLDSLGQPGQTPIPSTSWAFNPTIPIDAFDPELAYDYLEADGYDVSAWHNETSSGRQMLFSPGFSLDVVASFLATSCALVLILGRRYRRKA